MPAGLLRRGAAAAFWICAAAILWLALAPADETPQLAWDKANHALAFGVLFVLGAAAWPERGRRLAVALLAYGAAIELLQALAATRHADWRDVVGDAAGIAIGWALVALATRWSRRRPAP